MSQSHMTPSKEDDNLMENWSFRLRYVFVKLSLITNILVSRSEFKYTCLSFISDL